MMYANPIFQGNIKWLTLGTAAIPQWRYNLAMLLAFPGVILYGAALFAVQEYITDEKKKNVYHYLNAFGLTPWIALHLIYVVILSLFAWLNSNGFSDDATKCFSRSLYEWTHEREHDYMVFICIFGNWEKIWQ